MDITINSRWTTDCCGKQDLDFPILECKTRYWPDNSAICSFIFLGNFVKNSTVDENCYVDSSFEPIEVLSSNYIYGSSEEDVKSKVKEWYNKNILVAIEKTIDLIKK